MKRFVFLASIILTMAGGSTLQAAWVYGYGGPGWSGGWGPGGIRPGYGMGYPVPVVVNRPVYGYYYGYPPYGYAYVPAVNPYLPPAYTYPTPQAYRPWPVPVTPNGRPAWPATPASPGGAYRTSHAAAPAVPAAPALAVPTNPPPAAADSTRLAEQEKRSKDELTRVKVERNQARTELSLWTALGLTREQIKSFQAQLAKLQAQIMSLVRRNDELEHKLSRYEGTETEVKMPTGLRGKVMAVDSKYQFVVLNIGGVQGVAPDGKLLVSRGGKLVAKLRVTTVDSNSSVANILPDWKVSKLMEGDQVVTGIQR